MNIFVVCTADYSNIGDVVLRRGLLRSVSQAGDTVHAYVGGAPPDFVAAMAHGVSDLVPYADLGEWSRALRRCAASRIAYFAKPGEMLVGWKPFIRQALSAWDAQPARRHGIAVLSGCGLRSAPPIAWPYRMYLAGYDHVAWRDSESGMHVGVGSETPDWAFSQNAMLGAGLTTTRNRLTISLRGSVKPSEEWLQAVAECARQESLIPTVVVQVRHDQARAQEIAVRLNADLVDWNNDTHLGQERKVRAVYSQSAVVLSNRLHALIMGMTEGAVPVCGSEQPDRKVQRHFDVIGLPKVARMISSTGDLREALADAIGRKAEVAAAMERALQATEAEIARIRQMMLG